jgi:N-glycosylase/DNA lyase
MNFDLVHIFECGQCFRWNADEQGVYTGVAWDMPPEFVRKAILSL